MLLLVKTLTLKTLILKKGYGMGPQIASQTKMLHKSEWVFLQTIEQLCKSFHLLLQPDQIWK